MTAVPPPVPPEIVRRAAETIRSQHWDGTGCGTHGTSACSRCYGPSPADADEVAYDVLAAVYGDIVEAATTAAYDVCARQLASQRAAYEADYDRAVEAARRDALNAAIDAVEDEALRASRTSAIRAVQIRSAARIVTDLRDATAPPSAPSATVSDQQPESGSTPVRDSEGPQKRSEPFPPWVMQAMDDHQQQAEARMRRLLGTEGDA